MRYHLERTGHKGNRIGVGDSGPMSMAIFPDHTLANGHFVFDSRPQIGACMRVGSYTARSYANQDYWTTTEVVAILEDTPNRVVFTTRNSTYVWERIE